MQRTCKIYSENEDACNRSQAQNKPYMALDQKDMDILLSDPTGNGNGKGRQRNMNAANCDTEAFCDTLVTPIEVTVWKTQDKQEQITIKVNKNIVGEVKDIFDKILNTTLPNGKHFIIKSTHTYKWRGMQNDKGETIGGNLSSHSYGAAIDINGGVDNPYHYDNTNVDDEIHIRTNKHPVVQIFNSKNWGWGGRWSKPDYMHFSKDWH